MGDTGSGLEEYTTAAKKETAEIENIAPPKKEDETSDKSESPSEFETILDVKKTDKSTEDIAAPNEVPTTPNAKKDESGSFEFGCDDETSTDKNVATVERAPGVPTSESLVVAGDVGNAGEDVTAKNSSAAVAEKKNLSNDVSACCKLGCASWFHCMSHALSR